MWPWRCFLTFNTSGVSSVVWNIVIPFTGSPWGLNTLAKEFRECLKNSEHSINTSLHLRSTAISNTGFSIYNMEKGGGGEWEFIAPNSPRQRVINSRIEGLYLMGGKQGGAIEECSPCKPKLCIQLPAPMPKRWIWRCKLVISAVGKQRKVDPRDSPASTLPYLDSHGQWSILSHKQGGSCLKIKTQHCPPASSCMCPQVHVHSCTHTEHTNAHTQIMWSWISIIANAIKNLLRRMHDKESNKSRKFRVIRKSFNWSFGDALVVKSIFYSSRGPKFSSKYWMLTMACNFTSRSNLFSPLKAPEHMRQMLTHIVIHENKNKVVKRIL